MASPTCLDYTGEFSTQRQVTHTNTTKLKVAVIPARTPAYFAAVAMPYRKFGSTVQLGKRASSRHRSSLFKT